MVTVLTRAIVYSRAVLPSQADLLTWKWWKRKLLKHFLPIGFAVALLIGLLWPWPGVKLSDPKVGDYRIMQTIHIVTIFVVSGFTLKVADLVAAVKHPQGLVFGIVSIILITPLLGYAMIHIPFDNPSFATGFAIFCSVPTTLASGAALVKAAYGNGALALFFSVVGNIIGIFSVPFFLEFQLRTASVTADLSINPVNLIVQLLLTILLPAAVGCVLQLAIPHSREWAASHKTLLFLANNGSLVLIVWYSISRAQSDLVDTAAGQIMLMLLTGVAMHVLYLTFNTAACWALRLAPRDAKAVIIMGSQKTLPISVTLIAYMPLSFGSPGVLSVPCIIGHISQLFIDSAIVSRLAAREEARMAESKALEAASAGAEAEAAADGKGDSGSSKRDGSGSGINPAASNQAPSAATSTVNLTFAADAGASDLSDAHDAGPLAVAVSSTSDGGDGRSSSGRAAWAASCAGDCGGGGGGGDDRGNGDDGG